MPSSPAGSDENLRFIGLRTRYPPSVTLFRIAGSPWFLPTDASLHGPALDSQLLLNLWIPLSLVALAHAVLLLGLIFRRHSEPTSLKRIEYLPLAALAILFTFLTIKAERLWAATRYTGASLTALQIEATGVQFAWYFRYPGPDATFGITRPHLGPPAEG